MMQLIAFHALLIAQHQVGGIILMEMSVVRPHFTILNVLCRLPVLC